MGGITINSLQQIDDLGWGATFFGAGGGGTPAEGHKLLTTELADKGSIKCVDYNSIPDEAETICVSFMGNRAPLSAEQEAQKKALGLVAWKYENNMVEAVRFYEQVIGRKIDVLIIPELGGANTPGPIAAASALGLKVVDGDYCGRALPEVAQGGACLLGAAMTPIASVDKWGNRAVIYETVNPALGERLGKMLAMGAFGNTAIAFSAISGARMKEAIIPGTVTECIKIGQCAREARQENMDLAQAIAQFAGGSILFKGILTAREWEVKDGYLEGFHHFSGTNAFEGHRFKIWFRNENHIAWLDEMPCATSPDMICQIEYSLGRPLLNNECEVGQHFAIIAVPARKPHLLPQNLRRLNPEHYGFDIPYVPFAHNSF